MLTREGVARAKCSPAPPARSAAARSHPIYTPTHRPLPIRLSPFIARAPLLLWARHTILSPAETAVALALVAPAESVPTSVRGGGGKCSSMPLDVAKTLGFAQMEAASFESLLIRQPQKRGGCAEVYSIPRSH